MERVIGLATGRLQKIYGDREAIAIAARAGAQALDFDTSSSRIWNYQLPESVYARSEDEICSYFEELRRYAESLGLTFGQTHGRISGYKGNREYDDALIRNARLDCLAAKTLGAPTVIIHSVSSSFFGKDAPKEMMHDLNADLFLKIIPFAKEHGIRIASETFGTSSKTNDCEFFGHLAELQRSYERVTAVGDNARYMSYCMDTGHSNIAARYPGNPSLPDAIRALGKNISTLHLHDNDGISDQHKPPRTGTIDWHSVLDALDEIGYRGNYNLEVGLLCFGDGFEIETAEFSVKLMRHLLKEHYGA